MTASSAADWDIRALADRLGARAAGLDVARALARWRADGHRGSPDDFLAWVIATQAADDEQVVVTMVLPPRLAGARMPTVSADPTLLLEALPAATPTVIATPAVGDSPSDPTVVLPPPPGSGEKAPPSRRPAASPSALPTAPRYVILGEAGKGGMAVVHIARDIELARKVALKRLAGSAAAHDEVQARFLREVQISAQLDHPNIVPVYGLEVGPDGTPAYAMKLVHGRTLEAFLAETRAFFERQEQPDEAHGLPARLEHFLKVCDAIAYAHDKGVVHRDLKPANVMIGRHNEIYVMDWGICRVMHQPAHADADVLDEPDASREDGADTRTRVGAVVGTARYMAPEQAQGRNDEIGPETDQYALGLMLYEIATLRTPYDGRTIVDVLAHAARAALRPVRHAFAAGSVPGEVAAIIGRATALRQGDRYRDVRAFAADIRRFLRGDAVEARPDTVWQKAQRYVAQHRQRVLTAIAALVALMAVGTAGLLYRHEQALVVAGLREREVDALVGHVSGTGDLLQTRLLELQAEMDAFASASGLALQHTSPAAASFHWVDDFSIPSRQPPDLVAAGDGPPRSFTFAAWAAAPGADRAGVTPAIRRLLHVRPLRNDLFRRARTLVGAAAGADTLSALAGSGVEALVVGLATGALMHLPGHGALPREADPRIEPWYALADGHADARWGTPYRDSDSGRLLVPLAHAIRDDNGRQVGVTAMLLSFDRVLENLLAVRPAPDARATLLLDAEHRVIASSGLLRPLETSSGAVLLQRFPVPAFVQAIAAGETGALETEALGQHDVLAFDRVQPLGWALVTVTDAATVDARVAAAR